MFCCVEFGASLVALCRADAPFPMFIGEVLSIFFLYSLVAFGFCTIIGSVWALPFW